MSTAIPTENLETSDGLLLPWDTAAVQQHTQSDTSEASLRATERLVAKSGLLPECLDFTFIHDESGRPLKKVVAEHLLNQAKRKRQTVLALQLFRSEHGPSVLFANDGRKARRWIWLAEAGPNNGKAMEAKENLSAEFLLEALAALVRHAGKDTLFFPHGELTRQCRALSKHGRQHTVVETAEGTGTLALAAYHEHFIDPAPLSVTGYHRKNPDRLTHLDRLEAESIHIMREVAAEAENPVMLYSVGKDSSVMLQLARKAFYPSTPPFPLLHVDTGWKFQAMYDFRDYMAKQCGMELLVHINPEGVEKNINPFDHGSQLHTDIMKTQGLKQALGHYGFDVAFGGARRDEEKSRAKERIFSFRTSTHRWDPKNQRPELWNLYNVRKHKGESIRVFPLSNWTELDIWQYIYREQIPIVPLYFSGRRPVVERDGMLTLIDDDRLNLLPGEEVQVKDIRFRTLGCYPLTGAVESDAGDLASIMLELLQARTSERQGRAIDSDTSASMEKKKMEGYF